MQLLLLLLETKSLSESLQRKEGEIDRQSRRESRGDGDHRQRGRLLMTNAKRLARPEQSWHVRPSNYRCIYLFFSFSFSWTPLSVSFSERQSAAICIHIGDLSHISLAVSLIESLLSFVLTVHSSNFCFSSLSHNVCVYVCATTIAAAATTAANFSCQHSGRINSVLCIVVSPKAQQMEKFSHSYTHRENR